MKGITEPGVCRQCSVLTFGRPRVMVLLAAAAAHMPSFAGWKPPTRQGSLQTYFLRCSSSRNLFTKPSQITFALDPGGAAPGNGGQESFDGGPRMSGRTRLEIIVRTAANELLKKLNAARKNTPMKIFLLLLGFYTANALATILGQTGDWDVLVAGVVVAAIEGIGMLMYRKPMSNPSGRLKSFVVMVNFWKAGVCLGLFVDAFKLGS